MGRWFKSKSRKPDPSSAAENPPPYDVGEFSIRHGLSIFEARRILREARSREDADAAAEAGSYGGSPMCTES